MKKSLLGITLLTSLLLASNEVGTKYENKVIELINTQKLKTNNSNFIVDPKLNEKAMKRNKYLEENINDFFNEQIDKESNLNSKFLSGIYTTDRKIDRVNEIIFQKSETPEKTFENIFNNPYYRNTLLNKLNNKIGVSVDSKFITIYTSSSNFDKYCMKPDKTEKELCEKGDTNRNSDVDRSLNSTEVSLKTFYSNPLSINAFPYNNLENQEIYALNFKNTKFSKLPDSVIGFPISVNLGLTPESLDANLYHYKFSLKEKSTSKEIPFELIQRSPSPSELSSYTNYYNNNHYHYNFINYNDKIIQPLELLNYNTNYVLTVEFQSDKEVFNELTTDIKSSFKLNDFKWTPNFVKTFNFKTKNIKISQNEKVINIDLMNDSSDFEIDKNKEYILYSKNFFASSIKCNNNSIVDKLNYISYKFNNKGLSDSCKIYANDKIFNIKLQ